MSFLAITASGFPDYTARLVRQLIRDFEGRVEVIATRPDVPIEGMEQSLGKSVHWVEPNNQNISWQSLGLPVPSSLLLGGFFVPAFWTLSQQARNSGGQVFLASDNNWTGSLRQKIIDPIRHRLLLRRHFDGVMTAGLSGIRYSAAMGYPRDRIVPGMYGADPTVFFDGPPLDQRPKTFLYVGRFVDRKNVVPLTRAFAAFADKTSGWTLEMYGAGPDHERIAKHAAIKAFPFAQPRQLAEKMRASRCLVLPSKEEHWGVVVHEAALSGCALALSTAIGALDDFACAENSVVFSPSDETVMTQAFEKMAAFTAQDWQKAQAASLQRGAMFGPKRFSDELRRLVQRATPPAEAALAEQVS